MAFRLDIEYICNWNGHKIALEHFENALCSLELNPDDRGKKSAAGFISKLYVKIKMPKQMMTEVSVRDVASTPKMQKCSSGKKIETAERERERKKRNEYYKNYSAHT